MFTKDEYKAMIKTKDPLDELKKKIVEKVRLDIKNVEKYFSSDGFGIKPKAKVMNTYFELQKVMDPTYVKSGYAYNPLDGYYAQEYYKEFIDEVHNLYNKKSPTLKQILSEMGIKWLSIPYGSSRTIINNTHKPVIAYAIFKPAQSGYFIIKTARKHIGARLCSNPIGGQTDHSIKPVKLWEAVKGIKEYQEYGQKIVLPKDKIIDELIALEKQDEVISAL